MNTANSSHPPLLSPAQFFSIAEVALILNVSRRLVQLWIQEGRLPVFRLNDKARLIRIRRQDLETFIETHIRQQSHEALAEAEKRAEAEGETITAKMALL